tara:strand:+ start:260 stop:709 length:450 start_codon:yes stop_codon:yes gene_type:complete
MSVITENSTVIVHYTGKLNDGFVFDSSKAVEGDNRFVDREPLKVELGKGLVIPGFEKGLIGMKAGETKTIAIPTKEAYGEKREDMFQEIPIENAPADVKVGSGLQAEGPKGKMVVVVSEVKEKTVVIDANHPLAGKDLNFELEVVSIEK